MIYTCSKSSYFTGASWPESQLRITAPGKPIRIGEWVAMINCPSLSTISFSILSYNTGFAANTLQGEVR